MSKFSGFEEIQAWQKARDITLQIYRVTDNGRFARDFGLRDQIRRAPVSVMANIAEGHGRRSNIEFATWRGSQLS
jgi:four helix bundle protein